MLFGSNKVMSSTLDPLLIAADAALRTLFSAPYATRPIPSATATATDAAPLALTDIERREAGALMRVNHVGEVCAQALYTAQAAVTKDKSLREHFLHAARE